MKYKVVSKVSIRREPRIAVSNYRGSHNVGTIIDVFETVTQKDNSTWARISEPDAAGISLWSCVKELNRTYLVPVDEAPSDSRIELLEKAVANLTKWAKSHDGGFSE